MKNRLNFGPARHGETTVFGAARPGYPSKAVPLDDVQQWIAFMKEKGIRRVCSLLPADQLGYYKCDLLGEYKKAFGPENVCSVSVADYRLCDQQTLDQQVLPFLEAAQAASAPVVVHCSFGGGRTGHILAAWLVRARGLRPEDALLAVAASGRDPWEAVEAGNATKAQVHALLSGPAKQKASQAPKGAKEGSPGR